ncbi:polysaccharide biosynthesis C-terminal domain-containing protein [Desulfurivibrio alkaliphilus]|uniref:Cupin 2 conserved barrel domain protein n=1 Tax=Desulfurivibrio alkaliphilus (strain DSM 19089 / UNIQEM U267 / AHT2) TaxID=589865 RepID=D6YZS6_DESAT|nr:cupin domain-containing protein [Desulfurivibrio alkaliphilus]ADH85083.1 cupin 2 conserved barrel domain protein [Desulfurivibrio alkaliphilus AHT 2]
MQLTSKKPAFADARGEIVDIVEKIPFDSLTVITSRQGAVRGNHYHRETTQYTFILAGKCRYRSQKPDQPAEEAIMVKGDLAVSPPLESHAFEALEDSVLLAFCQGPRSGSQYETDTFRLVEPLIPSNEDEGA